MMTIEYGGIEIYNNFGGGNGVGYTLPAVKPVSRPILAIDPPLGDGKWLKPGQLGNGSVSITISWLLTGNNTVQGLSAALATLCGECKTLVVSGDGTWDCALEPIEQMTTQSFEAGTIVTATLNFTVYA